MAYRQTASVEARLQDNRSRILAAARTLVSEGGWKEAQVASVAAAAGMATGTVYRYFPSKEAIVEGLCLADQVKRSENFAELAGADDLKGAMRAALREHVLRAPREKARMIVEIWAEAGRNPRVAQMTRAIDAEVRARVETLMDAAKVAGAASPCLDSRFGARFFVTFVAGLFKRIAIEGDFDPEAETPMAIGVLKALLAGALSPDPGAEAR